MTSIQTLVIFWTKCAMLHFALYCDDIMLSIRDMRHYSIMLHHHPLKQRCITSGICVPLLSNRTLMFVKYEIRLTCKQKKKLLTILPNCCLNWIKLQQFSIIFSTVLSVPLEPNFCSALVKRDRKKTRGDKIVWKSCFFDARLLFGWLLPTQ
jgi:hypothetical protein